MRGESVTYVTGGIFCCKERKQDPQLLTTGLDGGAEGNRTQNLRSGAAACGKQDSGVLARKEKGPNHVRLSPFETGGAEGNRTPDLHVANVALSQLSYGPLIGLGKKYMRCRSVAVK